MDVSFSQNLLDPLGAQYVPPRFFVVVSPESVVPLSDFRWQPWGRVRNRRWNSMDQDYVRIERLIQHWQEKGRNGENVLYHVAGSSEALNQMFEQGFIALVSIRDLLQRSQQASRLLHTFGDLLIMPHGERGFMALSRLCCSLQGRGKEREVEKRFDFLLGGMRHWIYMISNVAIRDEAIGFILGKWAQGLGQEVGSRWTPLSQLSRSNMLIRKVRKISTLLMKIEDPFQRQKQVDLWLRSLFEGFFQRNVRYLPSLFFKHALVFEEVKKWIDWLIQVRPMEVNAEEKAQWEGGEAFWNHAVDLFPFFLNEMQRSWRVPSHGVLRLFEVYSCLLSFLRKIGQEPSLERLFMQLEREQERLNRYSNEEVREAIQSWENQLKEKIKDILVNEPAKFPPELATIISEYIWEFPWENEG